MYNHTSKDIFFYLYMLDQNDKTSLSLSLNSLNYRIKSFFQGIIFHESTKINHTPHITSKTFKSATFVKCTDSHKNLQKNCSTLKSPAMQLKKALQYGISMYMYVVLLANPNSPGVRKKSTTTTTTTTNKQQHYKPEDSCVYTQTMLGAARSGRGLGGDPYHY